jgi:enoyl-CoA hydratase
MATTTATEPKTLVNYRVEDGIAIIELSDPPANTYTYEMNRQLDESILKARMDNDVYVLLLTGAGDKFFSAGANIKMLSSVDPTFKYYFCLHANEMLLRLEHTPKLVKSPWRPTSALRAKTQARSVCRKSIWAYCLAPAARSA